jgi:hypothetical protein
MMHCLDTKNDLTFKRIVVSDGDVCMSLLNNMLHLEKDRQEVCSETVTDELMLEKVTGDAVKYMVCNSYFKAGMRMYDIFSKIIRDMVINGSKNSFSND